MLLPGGRVGEGARGERSLGKQNDVCWVDLGGSSCVVVGWAGAARVGEGSLGKQNDGGEQDNDDEDDEVEPVQNLGDQPPVTGLVRARLVCRRKGKSKETHLKENGLYMYLPLNPNMDNLNS